MGFESIHSDRGLSGVRRMAAHLLAACFLALLACTQVHADPLPEYAVKAACLFNFAKYTDWPDAKFENDKSPVVIGVLGVDPFGPMLERVVKGRSINNRQIIVQRGRRASDMKGAHVVFISAGEAPRDAQLCAAMEAANVLTVSDAADAADAASPAAVSFSIKSGSVVFTVNLAAAERSGLRISSKLLNLASEVVGKPGR
jgi:hypothetical protein